MINKRYLLPATCCALLLYSACTPTPTDVREATQPLVIYPDYQDVTIPCNIAPLNFMMRDEQVDALDVQVSDRQGNSVLHLSTRGRKAIWEEASWRQLMSEHKGDSLYVSLTARSDGQWQRYPDFGWCISGDSIDSYLTYRLIEPGYEVWDNVVIEERCAESFATRLLADGRQLGNRCMNCHTHGGERGQYSFFHLRGKDGGTILNRDGKLRKLTLRNGSMQSGAVYGDFHPSGRFAVYSTNVIIPAFHCQANRRLEVYDTMGDLCVTDFDNNHIDNYSAAGLLMTFPCFTADGNWIYYCAAPNPCGDTIPSANDLIDKVPGLHYSLYRIPFDAATGTMDSSSPERIEDPVLAEHSVNFPKCSPDGRYLMFSLSDYGTFPIWHKETTLCLMDLASHQIVNCQTNGTYHAWCHNSQWVVFASKREDGQYGRAYYAHLESDGSTAGVRLSKSLVLPQADPEHDDMNLRSYNIPDPSTIAMPFGEKEVKFMLDGTKAEAFD